MAEGESWFSPVRRLLLDPDTFFRQCAGQPQRYRGPVLVALITGIFTAVYQYLAMRWMFSILSPGLTGIGSDYAAVMFLVAIINIVTSALLVLVPFLIALTAGLVFFFLAGFFSKSGSFSHTIAAVGWGLVPLAAYEALMILLFLAFQPGMSITLSPEAYAMILNHTSPQSLDRATMTHMITYSESFYVFKTGENILDVLAWLCCAWFWIPAIRYSCAVEKRQAALIVLVPVLLYLGGSIGMFFLNGGFIS